MQPLPTYEFFVQASPHPFCLHQGVEQGLEIELQHVELRVPMSAGYECFSLLFRLPAEVHLPQAVYRLGQGQHLWDLLMTPTRPDAAGRQGFEAIVHREKAATLQAEQPA